MAGTTETATGTGRGKGGGLEPTAHLTDFLNGVTFKYQMLRSCKTDQVC